MRFCGRYDSGSLYIAMPWPEDKVWHEAYFGKSLTLIGDEGFVPIEFEGETPDNDVFIAIQGTLQATDEGRLYLLAKEWKLTRDPRRMRENGTERIAAAFGNNSNS